jgi:hypothetical protein
MTSAFKPLKPQVKPGVTALAPDRQKLKGVTEPRFSRLINHIEGLGARVAWSSAMFCPCTGANTQTRQPDPNCTKCIGRGVFYFGPKNYVPHDDVGKLDTVQEAILADDGAAVIRGLINRATEKREMFELLGHWVRGTMMLSVRPENKVGYYDRIVYLDSLTTYSETIDLGDPAAARKPGETIKHDPTKPIRLRYRTVQINNVESLTTRYEQGVDFVVTPTGELEFFEGQSPAVGTRLSVHYLTHPTYVVAEHPHIVRETPKRKKDTQKITPFGTPTELPIQALIKLEFLAGPHVQEQADT